MINEQIKSEVAKLIDDKLKDLKKVDLLNLPLISQYKLLCFAGPADGTALVPMFDVQSLVNRIFVLKSIRFDYYRTPGSPAVADIAFSDGTTEDIDEDLRINRIFDWFSIGTFINLRLNGVPISIFDNSQNISYPADLFLDNIFYLYPEKLSNIQMSINTQLGTAPDDNTVYVPSVKVTIECYLI